MSNQPQLSWLIYLFVIGIFVWRLVRPQRISVARLFVAPVLLLAVSVLSVYFSQQLAPAPPWQIAIVLALGALAGIPLGILRGKHSDVRPTERPGVMDVRSSPFIIVVWLGAFAARSAARYFFAGSTGASIWSDGLLAFAISALIVSYVAIYLKYQSAAAQAAGQAA